MTKRKTYYPTAGDYEITDTELFYVQVLEVDRSGTLYDILLSNDVISLNTRQVRYATGYGTLAFNEDIPFISGESVNVIYETTS